MAAALTVPAELHQPAPIDQDKAGPDDLTLWSVTTIIGALDKPALMYWSAEQAAAAACSIAKSLPSRIDEDGLDETVKWLRDARFRRPKDRLSDTAMGTVVHALAETWALTGGMPDRAQVEQEVRNEGGGRMPAAGVKGEADIAERIMGQFGRFLDDFQPDYLATEVTVYSPTYGYAGTCDGFFALDGTPLIFDYKSSRTSFDAQGRPKGVYPEIGLQLAAYRFAEAAAVWRPRRTEKFRRRYYLLSQQEQTVAHPVPAVEGGVGIHLSPERYGVYPVRCDEAIHEAFLFVLEAARFQFQTSKDVVGTEMVPASGRGA